MTRLKTFDELKDLFAKNPEEFEAYRQTIIDGFIANLPLDKHERARRVQWRIDAKIRNIKDPIFRVQVVYDEMLKAFLDLNDAFHLQSSNNETRPMAKILVGDFKKAAPRG